MILKIIFAVLLLSYPITTHAQNSTYQEEEVIDTVKKKKHRNILAALEILPSEYLLLSITPPLHGQNKFVSPESCVLIIKQKDWRGIF